MEQERTAKEQAEEEQHESQRCDKSPSQEMEKEELLGQGNRGDEGQSAPFILKRRGKEQKGGTWKKQKYNRTRVDPMGLTKGDLDEIGDKIWDTTIEVLQQFEQQHMHTLGGFQKDL